MINKATMLLTPEGMGKGWAVHVCGECAVGALDCFGKCSCERSDGRDCERCIADADAGSGEDNADVMVDVDGEWRGTLADFLASNLTAGLDGGEALALLARVRALAVGESVKLGGGAGATCMVKRTA
jgi:hypothetical protein